MLKQYFFNRVTKTYIQPQVGGGGPWTRDCIASSDKNKSCHTPPSFPSSMFMVIVFLKYIFISDFFFTFFHLLSLTKIPILLSLDYWKGVLTDLPISKSVYCTPSCSLVLDWLYPSSTPLIFFNSFSLHVTWDPNSFTSYSKLVGSDLYSPLPCFIVYFAAGWNYSTCIFQCCIISWLLTGLCPSGSQNLG